MTQELYITVTDVVLDEDGTPLPWKRADVIWNGTAVVSGWAPNFGVFKADGVSESSAVSRAQCDFSAKYLTDIRSNNEDSPPSWVRDVAAGVIERHRLRSRSGEGSEATPSRDGEVPGAEQ